MSAHRRLVAFNVGLALVGVALLLPWADVAGQRYHGPAFANLLLRLPEVRPLGDHLTLVAFTWYLIPAAALLTWGAQFIGWPPHIGWPSRGGLAVLAAATLAVTAWLAARNVGFPAPGPLVAVAGVGVAGAAALMRASRRHDPG
jgi:hypothetical protein